MHINAGANSTDEDAPLIFANANDFVTSSGYVFNLELREASERYEGYYVYSGLTFTALPASIAYGDNSGPHAATGTNLRLQIVEVLGPMGANFGFWERGWHNDHTTPTISIAGDTLEANPGEGLFTFDLTSNYPDDPFGHIHGRAFSSDAPGTFDVAFRIVDTTGYHTSSDLYTFRFQAIPEPGMAALLVLAGAAGLLYRKRRASSVS